VEWSGGATEGARGHERWVGRIPHPVPTLTLTQILSVEISSAVVMNLKITEAFR